MVRYVAHVNRGVLAIQRRQWDRAIADLVPASSEEAVILAMARGSSRPASWADVAVAGDKGESDEWKSPSLPPDESETSSGMLTPLVTGALFAAGLYGHCPRLGSRQGDREKPEESP
ncbi:MAG: hypothetical protein HYS12_08245 [Planctomycetes bacterium]|nr:hypothetical protein [Planctomycetota bacterium]